MFKIIILLIVLSLSNSVQAESELSYPAIYIKGDLCAMLDVGATGVTTTNRSLKIDTNGQDFMNCQVDLVENGQGVGQIHIQPEYYDFNNTGYVCIVFYPSGPKVTSDWRQDISASGQAKLTCRT